GPSRYRPDQLHGVAAQRGDHEGGRAATGRCCCWRPYRTSSWQRGGPDRDRGESRPRPGRQRHQGSRGDHHRGPCAQLGWPGLTDAPGTQSGGPPPQEELWIGRISLAKCREMYEHEQVKRIRRFNRAVTQRVGAHNDHFLSRDRPLGEARVLWEIGTDGVDVRALRSRLDLDSGYMSRLLRALERDGLVRVVPNVADRRVHRARLTDAGLAERAMLDQRSDELARSILQPLTDRQR